MATTLAKTTSSLVGRAFTVSTRRTKNEGLDAAFRNSNYRPRWMSSPRTTTTAIRQPRQALQPQPLTRRRRPQGQTDRRSSSNTSTTSSAIIPPQASPPPPQQAVVLLNDTVGNVLPPPPSVTTTSPEARYLNVTRHGAGDGVICLNVGGTEFWTLRSTVASNSVLADHVCRAEANAELTREGAVFIDRDPCQFDIILQHLRNKVEGLSYSAGSVAGLQNKWLPKHAMFQKVARPKTYVQLPQESEKLRDLYVEATHYRIPELQAALCDQSLWVTFASAFAGGGNPFDAASTLLKNVRRGLLATGGLGTLMIGADLGNVFDFEWISKLLAKKEEEADEDAASPSLA